MPIYVEDEARNVAEWNDRIEIHINFVLLFSYLAFTNAVAYVFTH